MNIRARAYPPRTPGRMNKTEAAYADHLELRRLAGEIASWRFEEIGLRLANGCFYYPDFEVVDAEGRIEYHEVKGYWREDARVKWKAAAERFSDRRFLAVKRRRGGGWEFEEYQP